MGCLVLITILLLLPESAYAQQGTRLFLRPHCSETVQESCPSFDVLDPLTLKTDALSEGEILDLDLVIDNVDGEQIKRTGAQIAYDPAVLEGVSIEADPAFPSAVPGKQDFVPEEGYIKLDLSAEDGVYPSERRIPVARIQLRVIDSSSAGGSALSFYDVQPGGHTVVVADRDTADADILSIEPGVLLVTFAPSEEGSPPIEEPALEEFPDEIAFEDPFVAAELPIDEVIPVEESIPDAIEDTPDPATDLPTPDTTVMQQQVENTVSAIADIQAGTFSLLQTRNVAVTTEGSTVYLGWDPLGSSILKAYNIYYGTLSGQYIQRKTVAATENSLTLRSLPTGTTYYFAIRGVSASDEESAFSQEVAITVGDPRTSTAPLRTLPVQGSVTGNPVAGPAGAVSVPGETGAGSIVLILLIVSASIGTILAWKRQCLVLSTPK